MEQLEKAARDSAQAAGAQAERARIKGIEDIAPAIGDDALLADAKFGEKPLTAEQLAFAAMQKQASLGADMLAKIRSDAKDSGADKLGANPNGGEETPEAKTKADEDAAVAMILGKKKEDK